jgi:hypothetical protein
VENLAGVVQAEEIAQLLAMTARGYNNAQAE